jgi:hypothetical protein
MPNDDKHIAIICGTCGSDKVSRDAWANWDTRLQQWVLGSIFEYGHCHRCDRESRLIEVELTSASPF